MKRSLLALCAFAVAALQAWDSNALEAPVLIQIIVAAGVLLPALAILVTADVRWRGAAVLVAVVLMVAARFFAPIPMPELGLAAFFPGYLVLLDHMREIAVKRTTRDPGADPGP